jgi:hypothetical protein
MSVSIPSYIVQIICIALARISLLPTSSLKLAGSIRHGEAVFNVHDNSTKTTEHRETCVSEELLTLLHQS